MAAGVPAAKPIWSITCHASARFMVGIDFLGCLVWTITIIIIYFYYGGMDSGNIGLVESGWY